jgi:hypothetical protein
MKRSFAQLLTDAARKAESSREITCPHCNETFTTSWRTDDVTSDTNEDDDANEDDEARPAEYENRRITKLNALTQSLTAATERSQI